MARDEAYRKAEEKIEEAQRSGATELDLSGMKLTELPESLGQLTQLQSLNLDWNKLTALPEWLGRLTQLQALNLAANQLTALPEGLGRLTQLLWLDLTSNQLTALPECLGQLTQLQTLRHSSNQLTALPEWLGQLAQLQELYLTNNQLTMLPEGLGQLTQLQSFDLSRNKLTTLPEWLGRLTQLQLLNLSYNQLAELPEWLGRLTKLQRLALGDNRLSEMPDVLRKLTNLKSLELYANGIEILPSWLEELSALESLVVNANPLTDLPDSIGRLRNLRELYLGRGLGGCPLRELPSLIRNLGQLEVLSANDCQLAFVPEWLAEISELRTIDLGDNQLTDLPTSLVQLAKMKSLDIGGNPLNPELAAARKEGLEAVKRYLRAKAESQVVLTEAKLILVGEGEVGKSCLLAALRGDPWEEGRPTTHGIEIKPVQVTDPDSGTEIILHGWDFGGQRVYRPTHQLFFTAPAVYLVVWKPREGPQQGWVKEWIKLVTHREPDAKILVVATHGGPKERQPDIDRQELWDLFGEDTVVGFFHVESKPGAATGERRGIAELREAIARTAASLPEMRRAVPKRWQEVREKLSAHPAAYLPLDRVLAICKRHKLKDADARLLLRICHRVGDLIHYEHDPVLRDIVVLKPDWLATAISFVLDDKETREAHGLVSVARLSQLWDDPARPEHRYPANLHPIFLRLMERFDLCYRVTEPGRVDAQETSLIAQLVPDVRPANLAAVWPPDPAAGDGQQVQICRIVDAENGQSATAEGLFYQLIVRLHKFSLGRANYAGSVHWQRGLVLEDDTGARAFLEHVANDVRITVRSPYPERFLSALTYEVQWLVESFWKGMRCEVTVPCLVPRTDNTACYGLFDVRKLLENTRRGRVEYPCPVCDEWQNIEGLLRNAPAARPNPLEELLANFTAVRQELAALRGDVASQTAASRELVSKVEAAYDGLMRTLLDEAKDGPRLFSLAPVDPGFFDRPNWMSAKFRLTLWCEHARLPLPALNGKGDRRGVYELTIPRDWFVKSAPFLRVLAGTLGLVMPVAASAVKLALDDATYTTIGEQLDLAQKGLDLALNADDVGRVSRRDAPDLEHGEMIEARGAVLRQLHAWLKEQDPSFGGLVRVQNKRQEFLWVHPRFEGEY